MRRVAMLCYFFPPIGGGGTPRSVEFVKHLPQFGYRPTVVTVRPVEGTFEREFQSDGEALEELSDSSFDLLRVPNPERPTYCYTTTWAMLMAMSAPGALRAAVRAR